MNFAEAYQLAIGEHVEKKGKFSYLSCSTYGTQADPMVNGDVHAEVLVNPTDSYSCRPKYTSADPRNRNP